MRQFEIFLRDKFHVRALIYTLIFASLGLALACLLPVQDDIIYQRFDAIVQCICETLNDIMKEEVDNESSTLIEYVLKTFSVQQSQLPSFL